MKKIFALILALAMVFALVACGTTETTETAAEYKLGMGVIESAASSATGNAQLDNTVAAVVTDAEGKIVMARIDVAQNKMNVEGGAVDAAAAFQTKMELGDAYGMAPVGIDNDGNGVTLEWYEQTKAFEAYVVGKTAAEVEVMELQEAGGHMIAVDTALLDAGCSMQITDFIAAVVKACNDEQGVTFTAAGEFTLGVAAATSAADSTAAAADADGVVKMYGEYGAAVVADGKIIAALNDANQPDITINVAGEIVEAKLKGTKRELKEAYGMAPVAIDNDGNGVTLEWFEQSAAFSAYAVGKTAEELANLETQEVNAHFISTDAALLDAGCSIQIGGMGAVIATAANYAR